MNVLQLSNVATMSEILSNFRDTKSVDRSLLQLDQCRISRVLHLTRAYCTPVLHMASTTIDARCFFTFNLKFLPIHQHISIFIVIPFCCLECDVPAVLVTFRFVLLTGLF